MKFLLVVGKRLAHSVFVIFGLSIVIFVISRIVPGDPARMALGPLAPQEVVERMRESMHLNDTLPTQYFYWLSGAIRGNLGMSLMTRRGVFQDVTNAFPATLELALFAGFFMTVGGITLGTISAHFKDKWLDNVIRIFAYMGVVTPPFVFGVIFVLVFGFWLNWFPIMGRLSLSITTPPRITGLMTIDTLLAGNLNAFWDALKHIFLPSLALSTAGLAQCARLTRSTISENLSKDYIASEKALGVPGKEVLWKFLLRPSLIPSVSILGLDIAATMGNAFLIEMIFNWPGLSQYGVKAMISKDLNAISGVVIILGLTFVTVNIIVDIVVNALDPRIRLAAQRNE